MLRFFLDAFGVPPHRIPVGTEARAAFFRSLLDGSRMLIVLDNASDVAQVRPLLPGSPGCLVVVTSRNEMAGLVAAEGAVPLTLDVLSDAEARELLARRLGRRGPPRTRGGGRDNRRLRPASAGSRHRRRAGRGPAPALAGRGRGRTADARAGWTCSRPTPPHRRAGRLLLVLRPARRDGGADVPAARPAPRPRHLARGGGEPGRADGGDGRGARELTRAHSSPSTCPPGSACVSCSPPTRTTRRNGRTPALSGGPPFTGFWITTCTRRWRPRCATARPGRRCG